MVAADIFTLICAIVGVASAAIVAFHPNILHAAVGLVFALLSVAGFYGLLGADFLAGAQLIIYVGGIIVVILFAIMMSEHINRVRFLDGARKFVLPMFLSVLSLIGLLRLVRRVPWPKAPVVTQLPTTEAMGLALVGPYALVFQYVAIVLLAGLIGAVIVARPHHHADAKKEGGQN